MVGNYLDKKLGLGPTPKVVTYIAPAARLVGLGASALSAQNLGSGKPGTGADIWKGSMIRTPTFI
jgi:hypothetical protein